MEQKKHTHQINLLDISFIEVYMKIFFIEM